MWLWVSAAGLMGRVSRLWPSRSMATSRTMPTTIWWSARIRNPLPERSGGLLEIRPGDVVEGMAMLFHDQLDQDVEVLAPLFVVETARTGGTGPVLRENGKRGRQKQDDRRGGENGFVSWTSLHDFTSEGMAGLGPPTSQKTAKSGKRFCAGTNSAAAFPVSPSICILSICSKRQEAFSPLDLAPDLVGMRRARRLLSPD